MFGLYGTMGLFDRTIRLLLETKIYYNITIQYMSRE